LIVSNTTPLTCLLKIDRADLLQVLYGRIATTPEVAQAGLSPLSASGWHLLPDDQLLERRSGNLGNRLLGASRLRSRM
jgi:predicted nucleic acid-binding protein